MKSCTLHAKKKVIQRNPISKFTDSFKSLTLGPSAKNHGTGEEKTAEHLGFVQGRVCSKRYPGHQKFIKHMSSNAAAKELGLCKVVFN